MDQNTMGEREKGVCMNGCWEVEKFPWDKRQAWKTREEGSVVRSKEFYIRGEVHGEALMHKCISVYFLVHAGSVCMFLCVCERERERERKGLWGLGVGDIEMVQDDILAPTFSKIICLTGLWTLQKSIGTFRIRETHTKAKELGWVGQKLTGTAASLAAHWY